MESTETTELPGTVATTKATEITAGGIARIRETLRGEVDREAVNMAETERGIGTIVTVTVTVIEIGRGTGTGKGIGTITEVKTEDRVVVVDGKESRKIGK